MLYLLPTEIIIIISANLKFYDLINLGKITHHLVKIERDRNFWEYLIYDIRPTVKDLGKRSITQLIELYRILQSGGQLFTWGHDSFGELGLNVASVTYCSPHQVDIPHPVIQVSTGYAHTGIVTNNGKLYMCGDGYMGQLGLGDNINRIVPVPLPEFSDVLQVSCGQEFTAFITQNGQVYVFGRLSPTIFIPSLVEELIGINIIQISCGQNTILALDDQGKVYLWENKGKFIPVSIPETIKQVSCGSYWASFLTFTGEIYHYEVNRFYPEKPGTKIVGLSPISIISAGYYHTIYLSITGEVYTDGSNVYGELGLGNTKRTTGPIKILNLPKIKQISGGDNQSALITSNGEIYVFGYNNGGILGAGLSDIHLPIPTLLPHICQANQISCGNQYMAVIVGN